MPIPAEDIKEGHCYAVKATNGRRAIVRVEKILRQEVRFTETLVADGKQLASMPGLAAKGRKIHFVWRYNTSTAKWSKRAAMPLARLAVFGESEVACE